MVSPVHCAGLKAREQTGAPRGGRQTERLTMCAARWAREEAAHRDRKRLRETGSGSQRPEAAQKDRKLHRKTGKGTKRPDRKTGRRLIV